MKRRAGVTAALSRTVIALLLLAAGEAQAFEVNGKHWDELPLPYYVNVASAPDFGDGSTAYDVVQKATEVWSGIGCAGVSFERLGDTDGILEADGKNTIYWVTDVWPFGADAAGATVWIPTEEGAPKEVDLALNAVDFEWTVGGADATVSDVVDPSSVIAHELGHWLGLAHSADVHATMYQAMLPNAAQMTPSGDDALAICTLYPSGEPECQNAWDCGGGYDCTTTGDATYCDELRDPIGSPCSKTHLNCADMCLISFFECSTVCAYETADLSKGYCAPLCTGGLDCPPGWTCTPAPSVSQDVCLKGGGVVEPPDSDLSPHEDAWAGDAGSTDDAAAPVEEVIGGEDSGPVAAPDIAAPDAEADAAVQMDATSGPDVGAADVAPAVSGSGAGSGSDAGSGCGAARGAGGWPVAMLALLWAMGRRRGRVGLYVRRPGASDCG